MVGVCACVFVCVRAQRACNVIVGVSVTLVWALVRVHVPV